MRRRCYLAAVFVVAALATGSGTPTGAQTATRAPQFSMPIACEIHVDCWIVNYFDSDPGPGAADYANGHRTYDDHNGTDFAVRDLAAMTAGVAVLAAADGTVRARRDGMNDLEITTGGRAAVEGRECGNGVFIDHAPGWATQYCHLRKGSVRVQQGQRVKAGDVLGLVGQSGLAEFPHVHFNVFRDKVRIDPFAPEAGSGAPPIWNVAARADMDYRAVSIYAGGFREAAPDGDQVKLGNIQDQALAATSPAIVFWSGLFGVRAGDTIRQTIVGPDGGVVVEREVAQQKNQIRRFLWIGKKRSGGAWPTGEYIGRTTVTPREGGDAQVAEQRVIVSPP